VIDNFNNSVNSSGTGGSVDGSAAINLNIADSVSSGSTAFFQISNESNVADLLAVPSAGMQLSM
jgi:hypothetical protein